MGLITILGLIISCKINLWPKFFIQHHDDQMVDIPNSPKVSSTKKCNPAPYNWLLVGVGFFTYP